MESLRQERSELAQEREETEEAMAQLLEATSADQEDLREVETDEQVAGEVGQAEGEADDKLDEGESADDESTSAVRKQLSVWKSRKKSQRKTTKRKVAIVDLAEAAQEAGSGEEEQLQAFRTMLGSMFGIRKPDDELGSGSKVSASPPVDGEVLQADRDSIEEPVTVQEPAWARNLTPSSQEVDRSSARTGENQPNTEADQRRAKSRELARRMAMTSLREVANQSARNALAEHTQRKLKRKMWIDGSLACISMGLGGAFLSQSFEQPMSWKTYGGVAVIIGVVAIVEMYRTFIRWQRAISMRKNGERRTRRPSFEDRYDRHTQDDQSSPAAPWPSHSQHSRQSEAVPAEVAEEASSATADMQV